MRQPACCRKKRCVPKANEPFNFALPYNPADIQPNARILLSAAIAVNGQLMFITDTVQTVINQGGTHADLTLVPVTQTAVPVAQ